MALNPIRLRRSIVSIGANDEQADEFTEALQEGFTDLVTKEDLARAMTELEHRLMNRVVVFGIALTGLNIAAMALLTQL